jgi:hypothetical protein
VLPHDNVLPQNKENAMIICNYIQSMKQELNLSDSYRGDVIIVLCNFSMFFKKSFKEGTREDILSFLNSFRKPEALDPLLFFGHNVIERITYVIITQNFIEDVKQLI